MYKKRTGKRLRITTRKEQRGGVNTKKRHKESSVSFGVVFVLFVVAAALAIGITAVVDKRFRHFLLSKV